MSTPATELPEHFLERLAQLVPADRLEAVRRSFATEKRPTFRVNPLQTTNAQALAELDDAGISAEAVAGLPHVYRARLSDHERLTHSDAFTRGRIYVANISSLLAAPSLDIEPEMHVLDLCAAPGGKSLHIAARLNNTGLLSVVESSRPRYYRLRELLRLHGVTCARPFLKDGRRVGQVCVNQFDRVLVDTPCSGESLLRVRSTDRTPNWSPRKIRQCAGKQRGLLESAYRACKPGGLVLYCTCTFAPEENEAVIDDLLTRHNEEVEVEPISLPPAAEAVAQPGLSAWQSQEFSAQLRHARRILPDEWFGVFFLCRLRKRG